MLFVIDIKIVSLATNIHMHIWYTYVIQSFVLCLINISQEGNNMITQELKDRLIADYPKFGRYDAQIL